MTRRLLIVTLFGLTSSFALAQPPQKPVPGPEHKRLGFFVGKWKGEGVLKENPFMPAGKHASVDTCEWFEGRFAVVCRTESKGPSGPMKGLAVLSYSPEERAYTYYGTDSSGMTMATVSKGTVEGDTWVYTDESKMGGKVLKSRYTIRELSPTSYSFKWEMQGDDGSWNALMEGKQTKMK
jgi:hypothetical protein